MENIFDRISENREVFSNSYKKVADYLSEHYEEAAFMSAFQIAQEINVSESVVIRFSKTVGYSGFPEMKKNLEKEIKKNLTLPEKMKNTDINENVEVNDIYNIVMTQEYNNVVDTLKNPYNRNIFSKVVETLSESEIVYVVGIRVLESIAVLFESTLGVIGKRIICINPENAIDMHRIISATKKDAAIIISYERYDKRLQLAQAYLEERGTKIITIADNQESPDIKLADYVMYVKVDSHSHFNSYCALFALINAIVTAVSIKNKESAVENLELLEKISGIQDYLT